MTTHQSNRDLINDESVFDIICKNSNLDNLTPVLFHYFVINNKTQVLVDRALRQAPEMTKASFLKSSTLLWRRILDLQFCEDRGLAYFRKMTNAFILALDEGSLAGKTEIEIDSPEAEQFLSAVRTLIARITKNAPSCPLTIWETFYAIVNFLKEKKVDDPIDWCATLFTSEILAPWLEGDYFVDVFDTSSVLSREDSAPGMDSTSEFDPTDQKDRPDLLDFACSVLKNLFSAPQDSQKAQSFAEKLADVKPSLLEFISQITTQSKIEEFQTILESSVTAEERNSQQLTLQLNSFLSESKSELLQDLEFHDQKCKLLESYNYPHWKMAAQKKKRNITAYTRRIEGSKLHMYKIVGEFDIGIDTLFTFIEDFRTMLQWSPDGLEKVDLISSNPEKKSRIWHFQLAGVFPIAPRDTVIQRVEVHEENRKLLVGYSIPSDFVPIPKGTIRAECFASGYVFEKLGENRTRMTFMYHNDPKGHIPIFLVNKSYVLFAKSFVNLQKYLKKHFPN